MAFRAIAVLLACWQLSRAVRPEVAIAHDTTVAGKSLFVPQGYAAVLVPLSADDHLGIPGKSHSQVGQDKLVQYILGCKKQGFYLDLAANDAVNLSNTVMLERDYGWTGICMEANPQYMLNLTKRRNCQVVLAAVGSPSGQEVKFALKSIFGGIVDDEYDNTPGEIDSPTVKMKTKAIAEILEELNAPAIIDYMSLDVEGAESFVMQGFPWDTHHFRVMTVERPNDDLVELLEQKGYHLLRENSLFHDMTYVDSELYEEVASAGWMQLWQDVMNPPSDTTFHENCPIAEHA